MTTLVAVERLTRRDEPAAVASLTEAFADSPLFPPLCPDPARRARVVAAYCQFHFRLAVRAGGAFGTDDRAAVACAWPPGHERPTPWWEVRAGGPALLWQLRWGGSRRLWRLERGFEAARTRHVPGPHWYIALIGVRPGAQRRGLGRAVLRPVFDAAERDGVPVYLETRAEANVAIYRRLGFELVGHGDLGGLFCWELRWGGDSIGG
jgi:ribosomal protein S18 acetylase RimI-like enzyme